MSYSEYSILTVTDGSSAVLSDIPARPEHSEWMVRALAEGAAAGERGEIPIGAVVVDEQGVIIGSAGNTRERPCGGERDSSGGGASWSVAPGWVHARGDG